MSITKSEIHWKGWVGSRTKDQRRYVAVWRVSTNNINDGPQYVLTNYGGAQIGTPYALGNDADLEAVCSSLTPSRIDPDHTSTEWFVTAAYESPKREEEEREDEEGNPDRHPLNWEPVLDRSHAQYQVPVERAIFLGKTSRAFGDDEPQAMPHLDLGIGDSTPVLNSAGVMFAPPLEKDESRIVYRCTKNFAVAPTSHDEYQDTINRDAWIYAIASPPFTKSFKKFSCKMQQIGMSQQLYVDTRGERFPYWRVVYEWHEIIHPPYWDDFVVDRGYAAIACDGDPDGTGNTVDPSSQVDGIPRIRRLVDERGYPTGDPPLLNGKGYPLSCGDPPVYLGYRKYDTKAFQTLQLDVPEGVEI